MRLLPWLVVCGIAIAGCSHKSDEGAAAGDTIAVTVQAARMGSIRNVVSGPGTVVPMAIADFVVTANEASEIAELPKNEGDSVKAGDVLVKLEVPAVTNEVATRQLELGEATTRLDAAKAEEAKLDSLVAQGLAPRNKLEAARTARMAAETAVSQIKTRFDSAKATESGATIRARFAGVVIKRWHNPGDVVTGGEHDPILRVIDPTRLQIAMQVPRDQIDRISQGQAATVQTGAGIEPALVAMKGAMAAENAPVEIRLTLTNTATPLALDAPVQAEIVLEEVQNVLVIPASAIQRGDKGPFVWVASDNGQAVKKEIRTGLSATGMTQVLTGLSAGEQVIVTGIAQLTEGATVTISK